MADDLRVIVDADADPLKRELAGAGAAVRGFGAEVKSQSRGALAFNAAVEKQKESLHGLGSFARDASLVIGGGLALAVGHMIKVGADFEQQMARVKGVTGATEKEMDSLRQLAIRLGAETKFSAGEAAEAIYELASAGFTASEMGRALPGTLSLAAASGVDLASAAEISSNALRGFGLEARESTHVADVLAKSVNTSSVEMEDLQLSLKYVGPVARATGESFESMIGAVSLMGDAGIKGEQAGTSLRGGLLRLVKPTKQVNEGLTALGLSAEDLQGPHGLLPLPQLVGKLQGGMDGLTRAQKSQALAQIFGTEALSGMLTVVEAGPAKLAKLTGEFEHSTGASAKAAKTMNDTVKGAADQLTGSLETVEIELYENLQEPLKAALLDATEIVNTEGKHLQKALDEAMATPEFKAGDMGQKVDILVEAIADDLDRSKLPEEMESALVGAFNWALPRVAEAAGKGSVRVAEAFLRGFMDSDALGKLVISAWLFTKLGGFAALRAAGARAGSEVGGGVATGIEESAATSMASPSASARLRDGLRKYVGRAMVGLTIADIGSIAGTAAGGGGGHVLSSTGVGAGVGMLFGPAGAAVGAGIGAIAGTVTRDGGSMGSKFATAFAEGFETELGPRLTKALRDKDLGKLEGVEKNLRTQIGLAISGGASDADVKPLRDKLREIQREVATISAPRASFDMGLDKLRSQLVTRMKDIRSLVQQNQQAIDQGWNEGSNQWRAATVQNMQAMVGAIRAGMHQGVIETDAGKQQITMLLQEIQLTKGDDPIGIAQGFADSWKKAGEINRQFIAKVQQDLAKMPKDARETAMDSILGMAKAWAGNSPKLQAQVDRLRSALVTKFGQTNRQLTGGTSAMLHGVAGMFGDLSGTAGEALQVLQENVASAMKSFGAAKIPSFELKVLSKRFGGGGGQQFAESLPELGRAGGGFISAPSRRDSVVTALGRDEAVLNVHQQPEVQSALALQKAMGHGRHGSLNELFTGITRPNYLATGGFAGGKGVGSTLPHPQIAGPGALARLGQAGVDETWSAAAKYLREHMGPRPGLGTLDGKPVSAWIIPILEWARQHGWGGSVTSGYRTPAQQMAAAIGYGLQHYGPAGPLGSNHTKVNYPGGAVDVSAAAELAAVLKGYPGKPNLVWGGPVMGDYVHFSATGHARGGFVDQLVQMAKGGWVRTGYTIYTGSGPGAFGDLQKGSGYAELGTATQGGAATGHGYIAQALGLSGELPKDYPLDVKVGAREATLYKRDRGYGQGTSAYSIDIHQLAWGALGLSEANGKGTAFIRSSDEAPAAGGSEKVPATYHGARTDSLDFGSMPNSLSAVEHELKRRRAELGRYRSAAQKAATEAKPKIEQAIRHNITALETRIQQLERERAKMRREVAKRKAAKRIAKALGKVTGQEPLIEAKRRIYEARSEFAEQVVGLEPLQPILPDSATDQQREAAERDYVARLAAYVTTQEQPAYEAVLAGEADWRNTILSAEGIAAGQWSKGRIGGMEGHFEDQIIALRREVDAINDLPKKHSDKWWHEHPKALQELHERQSQLPMLRFKEREFEQSLVDAREQFFPGGARVTQPRPPHPGTGAFEVDLAEVQGIHWSGLHDQLDQLPATRAAGSFGGAIWETQEAIEGLGLKIRQAEASINSAGPDAQESELKALGEEAAREAMKRAVLAEGETRVFGDFLRELGPGLPYVGAYMQGTGGMRVGRTGYALLHRDEMVTPDPKGPAGTQPGVGGGGGDGVPEITLVFADNSGQLVRLVDARVDGKIAKVNTQLGADARRRTVAPGIS